MFNEILTGRATLPPPPAPPTGGPYREPEVPTETRSCAMCRQAFNVPATSVAHTCVGCQLAAAAAASPGYTYENQAREPSFFSGFGAIRVVVALVIIAGGAIYSQVDGDAARVREAEHLADKACDCTDASCAQYVSEEFLSWTHAHGDEKVDDSDFSAVETSANRIASCLARFTYSGNY